MPSLQDRKCSDRGCGGQGLSWVCPHPSAATRVLGVAPISAAPELCAQCLLPGASVGISQMGHQLKKDRSKDPALNRPQGLLTWILHLYLATGPTTKLHVSGNRLQPHSTSGEGDHYRPAQTARGLRSLAPRAPGIGGLFRYSLTFRQCSSSWSVLGSAGRDTATGTTEQLTHLTGEETGHLGLGTQWPIFRMRLLVAV